MDIREHKCLRIWEIKRLGQPLNAEQRRWKWAWWRELGERSHERNGRCRKHPARVIRAVFPDYAEGQAIRVAKCESDHGVYLNVYARNPYSTASGLFQELDTWWAGKFNPFNPWANTRMALRLWRGSGESFYQHWAASAGCWG
jgi:hypothetical protein